MAAGLKIKRSWLWIGLMLAVVCGCRRADPVRAEQKPAVQFVDSVPQRRDADDTARFLAGMPGKAGSPFAALESSEAWKENRRLQDQAWKGAEGTMIAE